MSGNKITFASQAQESCNSLGQAASDCLDLFNTYFDRGYNGGGSDPIIDGDITSLKITASDIAAFITLAEQIQNFINNGTPMQSDYGSTISKMRTDI